MSDCCFGVSPVNYPDPDSEYQWDGGTKVCSNDPGHVTKMAAMPIYGKTPSNTFSETLQTWYTA